jgi:thymidine phosphorylase
VQATDSVDHAVGFSAIRKVGDSVTAGEPLFRIHAREETSLDRALALLSRGIEVS